MEIPFTVITQFGCQEMLPQTTIVYFRWFRQFTVSVLALELSVHPIHFLLRQEITLVPDSFELWWTECEHSLYPGPIIPPLTTV